MQTAAATFGGSRCGRSRGIATGCSAVPVSHVGRAFLPVGADGGGRQRAPTCRGRRPVPGSLHHVAVGELQAQQSDVPVDGGSVRRPGTEPEISAQSRDRHGTLMGSRAGRVTWWSDDADSRGCDRFPLGRLSEPAGGGKATYHRCHQAPSVSRAVFRGAHRGSPGQRPCPRSRRRTNRHTRRGLRRARAGCCSRAAQ